MLRLSLLNFTWNVITYHSFLIFADDGDVLNSDLSHVSDADFADVEADSFWCFSKLLDSIQDHYVFAQPGIQRMVFKLKELTQRTDREFFLETFDLFPKIDQLLSCSLLLSVFVSFV